MRCGVAFVFFQAEDGIRDLVRSRGLGDVYKRQELQGRTDIELALRLYGHQTPIEPGKQDCNDTRLELSLIHI